MISPIDSLTRDVRAAVRAVRVRRWPAFLDGAFDGIVLTFAGWTLFYELALALQFSMLWAGWPWLVISAVVVIWGGIRSAGSDGGGALLSQQGEPAELRVEPRGLAQRVAGSSRFSWPVVVAIGVTLVVLVLGRGLWGVWPTALLAMALLAIQLAPWLRQPAFDTSAAQNRSSAAVRQVEPTQGSHLFALLASMGLGVLGSFLLRPDADDAFYVNRATWVAAHGTAALNDTMFSPNTLPPAYSGGLPTPSIEAAQGVVAHALGVEAASFCYLLAVPVLGAFAGWTTWRLVRQWAPRRWALVMGASMLFLLASSGSIVGNYSVGRIWQGKATAYIILLPLVWLLLSRCVARAGRRDLVMLVAAGVAFVGLTTTSALLAPMVTASALLAALVLRAKPLALGAVGFIAAPLISGLVQVLGPAAISGGGGNATIDPPGAFAIAFGSSIPMILLGLVAVLLIPRSVPGAPGVLLGCAALVTIAALLPGVFELADAVTGAGAIAWRLVIGMPIWILVGLLTSIPPSSTARNDKHPQALRLAAIGVIGVVLVVPVVWGTWLWNRAGAELTARPTWKVDQLALADVRAAQERDIPPGLWLMPPVQMEIQAISAVGPFAVVPRAYYLPTLAVPAQELDDRVVLYRLAAGRDVPTTRVRSALKRLDVSLACVSSRDRRAVKILSRAVRHDLKAIAQMRCHIGPPKR